MLLELDGRGPRYQQLTRALSAAIRSGRLPAGSRVPASRELARTIGCSRNIVMLAYDQLLSEGYLIARPKAGTFVAPGLEARAPSTLPPAASTPPMPSASGERLVRAADHARALTPRRVTRPAIDFVYGLCQPDLRLVARLKQGLARALAEASTFGYGSIAGDDRLRAQIAQRLHGARGIQRGPEHIVITNGAQQALDLCARLLLDPGDRVVMEDPGYEGARATFQAAGADVLPVAVDRDGVDPSDLPTGDERVRLAYVTPSHQFPTGVILTAARRRALLAWARQHRAHVLEDDYDGDLRYSGIPVRALAGFDDNDQHVIYCGTFAKALFPSLRLAYLSLPPSLVEAATSAKWVLDRGSSLVLQRVVADLMATGEYDRHVQRLHRRYAARRAALVGALRQHLGAAVEISGDAAGLHLVVWCPALRAEDMSTLVSGCAERGIAVYDVAPHAVRPLVRQGLILGYGLLEPAAVSAGVRVLSDVYHQVTFKLA